jgi:colanic acid biosynthesis glycosyl transferase WcaI
MHLKKREPGSCTNSVQIAQVTQHTENHRARRSMKILIYSANFAPEPTGIGKYSGEMARWLAEQGHEVRVIAAPPYYPNWELAEGYTAPIFRRETWKGVDVWRAPLWVPRNPGGLKRVLHLLTFGISSLPVALWQATWRPDVVVGVAPALVTAPAALAVARLCGAKAWLHIQDFEVDVAFRMGLLQGKWPRRIVSWLEGRLLRRFDAVSSISDRMVSRLLSKGVQPEKVRSFPNWVDISQVQPLQQASAYRTELGIEPGTKVVLFSGTLGSKQGLSVIPQAARLLADRKDILFIIGGEGVMKAQLQEESQGLSNVRFLPLQPQERMGEWLGLADIHVLPQSPEAEDLVLPSKLAGMLASGRPVVTTSRAGTELARVVSTCGAVVAPEDASALAAAVIKLMDSPEDRAHMGAVARRYAEDRLGLHGVLSQFETDCLDMLPHTLDNTVRP